jgi:uncharacterized short protein YbdD (DUF466 family)
MVGRGMKLLLRWWRAVGEVLGDGEYSRYCAHMNLRHPGAPILKAGEFYQSRLEEKYAKPNRCC